MATPVALQHPKAMQAACVRLPEEYLVPHGKDGFRVTKPLPVGTIVFGHGACIVRCREDYDKVATALSAVTAEINRQTAITNGTTDNTSQRVAYSNFYGASITQ